MKYCPLSQALGIESDYSVLDQRDDFIAYDPTISSLDAIKRNSEFVECPQCGVTGNYPNMQRWHFDKCKTKLRQCLQCGDTIPRQGCKESVYKKKLYCGNECYALSKKGKCPINMTNDVRKKISEAALKDSQNRSNRMKQVKPWKYRWNI